MEQLLWTAQEHWPEVNKQLETVAQFPLTAQALVVLAALAYWQSKHSYYVDLERVFTKRKKVCPSSVAEGRQRDEVPETLPDDVYSMVLSFLDARTTAGVASVSRRLRQVAEESWSEAFQRDFPEVDKPEEWSWKEFYSIYALAWLEYRLVGSNVEHQKVFIGIKGSLYDVTTFVRCHPGSKDALLDNAGSDATDLFTDVGHSTDATKILKTFLLVPNPNTGALERIHNAYATSRKLASALRPSCCPGHHYHRLFFDYKTNHWRSWCPRCHAIHTLHIRGRPRNEVINLLSTPTPSSFHYSNIVSPFFRRRKTTPRRRA